MQRTVRISLALSAFALLTACGEKKESESAEKPPASPSPSAPAPAAKPTGKTIVVELYTDEKGNYFKPNRIEAHQGDLIRFTLAAGVHNVHFLPDSNPGKSNLPAPSEFLQLPGQTYDFVVNLAPGKYYFQCDPHALLGMVGRLEVEDEK